MNDPSSLGSQVAAHYASGYEARRLYAGSGLLERERSRELIARFIPAPPATVLDIGGGPGDYALWLAAGGYRVHLVDITPLHVRLALEASAAQPQAPLAGALVGDARALSWPGETVGAALLFGPLYHLTEREDRLAALGEAYRVLAPGGVLLAAAISRYASLFDGLRKGFLKDPHFAQIVARDLRDGQHRNPTGHPSYFTDTFFHHPDELRGEIAAAGFQVQGVYGVEGPAWLAADLEAWWADPALRQGLLDLARALETDPAILSTSAHLMAVAYKPGHGER